MTSDLSFFDPALVEWAEPGDRTADYCLWEYAPLSPMEGKFRQSMLLFHALDVAGCDKRIAEAVRLIRSEIGAFRTVWGVKLAGGQVSTELYFYDYARLERDVSIRRVLRALSPLVACDLKASELRPYFMASVELDDSVVTSRCLTEIDVYMGSPGASVSAGTCHALTTQGLSFKNFYFFFDALRDMEDIAAKIACSAHLDLPGLRIEDILWPQLVDCSVIVVANKRSGDGVYFSRIRVEQLIFFLERLHYPPRLVAAISANRGRLDHLLFDVGFDYVMLDGRVSITKSAFYGIV